jgi:hypothetical protein
MSPHAVCDGWAKHRSFTIFGKDAHGFRLRDGRILHPKHSCAMFRSMLVLGHVLAVSFNNCSLLHYRCANMRNRTVCLDGSFVHSSSDIAEFLEDQNCDSRRWKEYIGLVLSNKRAWGSRLAPVTLQVLTWKI